MRKPLAAGMAALSFAVATAALPTAASAADYRHGGGYYGHHGYGGYDNYRHRGHGDDAAGAAIIAGVAGLALGAALSNNHSYYNNGYYDRGYYDGSYYARPRVCITERWVWDPYIGRRVPVRERYYC